MFIWLASKTLSRGVSALYELKSEWNLMPTKAGLQRFDCQCGFALRLSQVRWTVGESKQNRHPHRAIFLSKSWRCRLIFNNGCVSEEICEQHKTQCGRNVFANQWCFLSRKEKIWKYWIYFIFALNYVWHIFSLIFDPNIREASALVAALVLLAGARKYQ